MPDDGMPAGRRLERISALLAMGRLDDAQREALTGVAELPDADRLWAGLAAVELRRADYPAAIYAAERALSLNPSNTIALHGLGPAYFHSKRPKDARRAMDQLVAIAPEWAPGLVQRASVYSWTAQNDTDREVVRDNSSSALRLDPHSADAYGVLAEAHHQIGDQAVARQLLDEGLRLDPTAESLLLRKVRFGGLNERESIETARAILAVNPLNVHALRLIHFATWRRLMRLAAWPSIVGALSSTLAYTYFLHGGADGARLWLGILLVPAVIAWGSMFLRLSAVSPPDQLAAVFRSAPLGLLGFVITAFATVALIAGIVTLFTMPLRDPAALRGILTALSTTAVALAFADMLMRVGALRLAGRTGLFTDTPEGRLSAYYASRGQADGTFGRLATAAIVLVCLIAALWMPGVAALAAIALALIATVFVKVAVRGVLQRKRLPAVWFALGGVALLAAVVLLVGA